MAAFITLAVMGLILGLGLAISADYLKVEVDERIQVINDYLPQYNCGACGYPGCQGFAEGIIDGKVEKLSDCKPGKDENYNPILEYIKDHPNNDGSFIKVIK